MMRRFHEAKQVNAAEVLVWGYGRAMRDFLYVLDMVSKCSRKFNDRGGIDPTTVKEKLGWEPKISFAELVAEMVRADLEDARRDELCKSHGFKAAGCFAIGPEGSACRV